MSPIFVRPVREQLEHDRLIRHLLAKYKRKSSEVAANVGDEQVAPVKIGANTFFPDLVVTADRKLAGLVEVESGESVNNLEAMAQWVHFGRARVPFHLYVPVHVYDSARRLCDANHVKVAEIWTYRAVADGFDLVRIHLDASTSVATTRSSEVKPAASAGKTASTGKVANTGRAPNGGKTANDGKAAAAAAKTPKPKPAKVPAPPPKAKRPAPPPPKARKKPAARPSRPSRPAGRSKRR